MEVSYKWFGRPIPVRITAENDYGQDEYIHGYVLGFSVITPDDNFDAIITYLMDDGRQIVVPKQIRWDA